KRRDLWIWETASNGCVRSNWLLFLPPLFYLALGCSSSTPTFPPFVDNFGSTLLLDSVGGFHLLFCHRRRRSTTTPLFLYYGDCNKKGQLLRVQDSNI
ncbi:unnamed protein product, partial [Musa acuminata subsp. burmannicoides]